MILARLKDVSRSYAGIPVLEGVSLDVAAGCRLGVVGRNGSGKTTLLNLLAGRIEPDSGEVWRRQDCRVAFLEQMPERDASGTVESSARAVFDDLTALANETDDIRHALGSGRIASGSEEETACLDRLGQLDELFRRRGGYEVDFRVRSVLIGLGFSRDEFDKPVSVLSGGEKNRLVLARILLSAPDLLFLDEPTNHLDLGAIEWLESYLASWEGSFLLISHDRFLLDQVTRETLVISRHRATRYAAPYTQAMTLREEERARQEKRYVEQQKEIARQEDFIRRNIADQKTTKRAQSRRKMLERMERVARPESDGAATRIRIEPQVQGGRDVLRAEGIVAEIEGRVLFRDLDLHLLRGDRLGILGPNGTGKTTLLNILAGRREPDEGSIRHGVGIMVGLLDQELESLADRNTVLAELHALRPLAPEGEMRSYLARFLFRGEDVFKTIGSLSGGERSRAALAKLFLEGPNVLFLDEPTNHLDIDGRRALEAALREFTGTVVAVSHDRYFLNRFARAILHLHDGRGELTLGNFNDFKARQAEVAAAARVEVSEGAIRHEERKRLKREREKRERERKLRLDRMVRIESEMAELDQKLEEVIEALSEPDQVAEAFRDLRLTHRRLVSERSDLYAAWERLVEELAREDERADGPD